MSLVIHAAVLPQDYSRDNPDAALLNILPQFAACRRHTITSRIYFSVLTCILHMFNTYIAVLWMTPVAVIAAGKSLQVLHSGCCCKYRREY